MTMRTRPDTTDEISLCNYELSELRETTAKVALALRKSWNTHDNSLRYARSEIVQSRERLRMALLLIEEGGESS